MTPYVNDTLASDDPTFEKLTARILKTFESNKYEFLPYGCAGITKWIFPRTNILWEKHTKLRKIRKLGRIPNDKVKNGWIINIWPELTARAIALSNVQEKTHKEEQIKKINDLITPVTGNPGERLKLYETWSWLSTNNCLLRWIFYRKLWQLITSRMYDISHGQVPQR